MSTSRRKSVGLLCVADNPPFGLQHDDHALIFRLLGEGWLIHETVCVPDDDEAIAEVANRWLSGGHVSLIVTVDISAASAGDIPPSIQICSTSSAQPRLTHLVHDTRMGFVGLLELEA